MNNYTKGSLALFVARIFSGLNVNVLGYLLPLWIAPLACVTLRLLFGSAVFLIVGIYTKPENIALGDKLKLVALGAFGIFGYMSLYALSLSYTTPVNFAIFNAMQPLWVVIVSAVIYRESVDYRKLLGLALGFAGALLCILSEPSGRAASNPLLYSKIISKARTVIWNGPMGVFEFDAFSEGTNKIAKAIAACHGTTIVGGGDSIASIKNLKLHNKITHISTGGGASLQLLQGDLLPGVEVIENV